MRARVAAATSAWRIRLSPTRKVDDADLCQPGEIVGREDAAFADHHAIVRHQRRQPLGHLERGDEGLEVAVVDADERRLELERALELGGVVHLEQHVHAVPDRSGLDLRGRAIVERRHDDEDAVGAHRARFRHLIRLVHEVLAQHRQVGCRAGGDEELGRALERGAVGEDREAGGAARLVGPRQRRRIEVGADQPPGRARLLDLGDQGIIAAVEPALDRAQKAARRVGALGRLLHLAKRPRALRRRDLLALIGFDAGENVSHGSGSVRHCPVKAV